MSRADDDRETYLTTLKSLIVWGKAENEHDNKVKNILKNLTHSATTK